MSNWQGGYHDVMPLVRAMKAVSRFNSSFLHSEGRQLRTLGCAGYKRHHQHVAAPLDLFDGITPAPRSIPHRVGFIFVTSRVCFPGLSQIKQPSFDGADARMLPMPSSLPRR